MSASAARVVAQVDQIVDPPHRLTEQRPCARLPGRLGAADEGLDDLEGEHRREAGTLDQLLAGGPFRRPDDGLPLRLERGTQLCADAATQSQPRVVPIGVVQGLEEGLDDRDRECRRRILRERRRDLGPKPAAFPGRLEAAARSCPCTSASRAPPVAASSSQRLSTSPIPRLNMAQVTSIELADGPTLRSPRQRTSAVAAPKASAVSIRAAACSLSNSTVSATLACGSLG